MTEKIYLTIREVAERLGVTEDTVRWKVLNGNIPAFRLGNRCYRIHPDDLNVFNPGHQKSQSAPITDERSSNRVYLTAQELATIFGVRKAFIYDLINLHGLPALRVGKLYRIDPRNMRMFRLDPSRKNN